MPNAPYTSSTNPTGAEPTRFGKITAQIVRALLGDVFEFLASALRVKKPLTVSGSLTVTPFNPTGGGVYLFGAESFVVTDGFDYAYHRLNVNGDFDLADGVVRYRAEEGVTANGQLVVGQNVRELRFESAGSNYSPGNVMTVGEDGEAVWKPLPTGSAVGIVGSINPEGAVIANPGVTYLNTVLKTFWVKETGSGATGWLQLI